jgi:hypothetical protein
LVKGVVKVNAKKKYDTEIEGFGLIKNVCVFLGSRKHDKYFEEQARHLGALLAKYSLTLVYGGGGVGLMGEVARGAIKNEGEVVGVMPISLVEKQEPLHGSKTEIVNTGLERKQRMYELSDAFVVLPGGFGTVDEIFDILFLQQIGEMRKPLFIVNLENYWDKANDLMEFFFEREYGKERKLYNYAFVKDVDEAMNLVLQINKNAPE